MAEPFEDFSKHVSRNFILFLLLFVPFGILIVAMLIAIKKFTSKWKNRNT